MCLKARSSLPAGYTGSPWTMRTGVSLRGCTRQVSEHSFLSELVNIRWMRFCVANGITASQMMSVPAPKSCWTDLRQNINRQLADGSATMLRASLFYAHYLDRVACAEEMMLHQGWDVDVKLGSIDMTVPNWPAELRQCKTKKDVQPKRQRLEDAVKSSKSLGSTIRDLAGDAMCIADLSCILYAISLASPSDVFECPPLGGGSQVSIDTEVNVVLDPAANPFLLRRRSMQADFSEDAQGADLGDLADEMEDRCEDDEGH